MHRTLLFMLLAFLLSACDEQPPTPDADIIFELEKSALDRWGNGDPFGYIELAGEEITYFDPSLDVRLDSLKAFTDYLTPVKGKIHVPGVNFIKPTVQLYNEVGILTFNLENLNADGQPTSRWNCTEVYHRISGKWKLVHSHWSMTKPQMPE